MQRNIKIIYATSALSWARFFVPVLALFYIASEVTIEQFGIIMAVFSLTILLLEIPSGVIADLIGKRKALIISKACYLVEVALLAFTNGFWPFLIAKVISGIGVSFGSGTVSSLLYDSLRRDFKDHRHKEIKGKQTMITYTSMAFTFIIGAYLFTIDPKLPAKFSIPFMAAGLVLTFFLKEPYAVSKHVTFNAMGDHLKSTISYLKRHAFVRRLVLFNLPVAAAISIALSYSSIYYEAIRIPVALIGIVAFAVAMTTAFAAKKADWAEFRLREEQSLIAIAIGTVLAIALIALTLPYVSVVFYLFLALMTGFFEVIIDHYVNKHIETSHRTTMLSINNLFANLAAFILFPIIGAAMGISIGVGFGVLAGIVASYMAWFFLLRKRRSI